MQWSTEINTEIRSIDATLELLQQQVLMLEGRRADLISAAHMTNTGSPTPDQVVPSDIQEHVLVHLDASTIRVFECACRDWHQAAQQQPLWQRLFQRDLLQRHAHLFSLMNKSHVMVLSWRRLYTAATAPSAMAAASQADPVLQSLPVGTDTIAWAAVASAVGPDEALESVGVGSDGDIAEVHTTSTAAGVEHLDVATGMNDLATVATTSTAAGIDRTDMGTSMTALETCTTASTAVGVDRADMATSMLGCTIRAGVGKAVGIDFTDRATSTCRLLSGKTT